MWEESPIGTWTLEVLNDGRAVVELKQWSVAFFGTKDHPQPNIRSVPRDQTPKEPQGEVELNQVPDIPAVIPNIPVQKTADVTGMHNKKPEPLESGEGFKLEHCLDSTNPDWCSVCESGFLLFNGRCLDSCPVEGYYKGSENHQESCLQCYYSCKTCNGPNDYQVISRVF